MFMLCLNVLDVGENCLQISYTFVDEIQKLSTVGKVYLILKDILPRAP